MTVSITKSNDQKTLSVSSGYDPELVKKFRLLGGKWNPVQKTWEFRSQLEEQVQEALRNVLGDDGSCRDLITLEIKFLKSYSKLCSGISFAGRTVARAYGRDTGAKIGDNVAFLKGGAESGGSMKNWRTEIEEGSIVHIYDIPRTAAQKLIDELSDEHFAIKII